MAHARRSPQHRAPSSSISSPFPTRRKVSKRATSRLASDASSYFVSSPFLNGIRPPLVPLQANLRRLPSRIRIAVKDGDLGPMRDSSHVIAGSKRKRVASINENAHNQNRLAYGSKRRRTASEIRGSKRHISTSEESASEHDEMEIDVASTVEVQTDDNEREDGSEEEVDENDDSSDDFYLNEASSKRLNKLLKKRLVGLYRLTGLTEPPDLLKKTEIIDAIVNARDDFVSVPPSSPPGRTDVASSEYQSSDDGNFAGDETDAGEPCLPLNGRPLMRRVTVQEVSKPTARSRTAKGRSASLNNVLNYGESSRSATIDKTRDGKAALRRRASARSSPATSGTASSTAQSPPVTRLRSRQASGSIPDVHYSTSPRSKAKGKSKSKQVEFSSAVEVRLQTPSKRSLKGKKRAPSHDSEGVSQELEYTTVQPSPRRLRSKDRECKVTDDPHATPVANSKRRSNARKSDPYDREDIEPRLLRVTHMRKAKDKSVDLVESDEDEEGEDSLEDGEPVADEEDEEADEDHSQEEDEIDELVSSASVSPPESQSLHIPTKRRSLRPRRKHNKIVPTGDEGDDEEEEEESDGGEGEEEDVEEATLAVEPRKLRNGKIVSDVEEVMDVDRETIGSGDEEANEGEDLDDAESVGGSEVSLDHDDDTEEQEELMEEDVDLTVATTKTLIRLRRDDLVRLCESREIDPSGTKPQLAEALLQWRDRLANDFSSPSSTGTIRPVSFKRNRKTRKGSSGTTTTMDVPLLLRSHHVLPDEPYTPVPEKEKEKENEDLELDLESLGLEDREIPPDKLAKLEKIGSGGFKDVFIGKFKGRKVAIAEFRGQLSAMDIKELKLLGEFHHPNIVRFLGVSIPENTKETPVMIVSELCSNGDLFDYIRNVIPPNVHKVLKLMLDVACGLEYLHARKPSIIHRDCKSSNILITARGVAKIADFGLAKVKQSTRSMVRSLVGTVNWQAPELWTAHPKYNYKVDVFSCAMVFWEVLQWHQQNKKFPWEGMNEHAIYDLVGAKKQRPSTTGLKKQWCPEVIELIEHMWAQEPQDRPTMTEVVETLEDLLAKY